jgi:ethanolamine utilization protein EutA
LRARLDQGALPWPLLDAGECIRATALGASEYSVQLSGSTSFISDPGTLLPRRNLQVLRPPVDLSGEIDAQAVAAAIARHLQLFDIDSGVEFALAFEWAGEPEYGRIRALAEALKSAVIGRPILVMLDGDVAMTLGSILKEELAVTEDVLVLDGLSLHDFDFLDLGRIRLPSRTVPVTVKSLVFSEAEATPGQPQRLHHREWGEGGSATGGHRHDHHHGHDHGHGHHHHHHDGEAHSHGVAAEKSGLHQR